jgi:hypothetical protein
MESKHTKNTQHWLHPPSTDTSNRFSALWKQTAQIANTTPTLNIPPKPPPIYIQYVTTIPPLLQLLEQVAPHKYETKALSNNKVKIQPTTSDSLGQLSKP